MALRMDTRVNQLTASSPAVLSDRTVPYAAGISFSLWTRNRESRWGFESTGTVGAPPFPGWIDPFTAGANW